MLSPDGRPRRRCIKWDLEEKKKDEESEDKKIPRVVPPPSQKPNDSYEQDNPNLIPEVDMIYGFPKDRPANIKLEGAIPPLLSGLSTQGIALAMDNKKPKGLFREAEPLLEELVSSPQKSIQFIHDDDWVSFPRGLKFPAVGLALRKAGRWKVDEELSYCVAICSCPRIWAVGISSKWANRLTAAKLAIALTLAHKVSNFDTLCIRYPELRESCKPIADEPECTPEPDWKADKEDGESNGPLNRFPRDSPMWIKLPEDKPRPPCLDDLPGKTIAVCADNNQRALYSQLNTVLELLIRNPADQVSYHDDVYGDKFPAAGAAIKQIAKEEASLTIAVCSSLGAWGVGIGTEGLSRFDAAKLSLASVLACRTISSAQGLDLSPFPDFDAFVGGLICSEAQPQSKTIHLRKSTPELMCKAKAPPEKGSSAIPELMSKAKAPPEKCATAPPELISKVREAIARKRKAPPEKGSSPPPELSTKAKAPPEKGSSPPPELSTKAKAPPEKSSSAPPELSIKAKAPPEFSKSSSAPPELTLGTKAKASPEKGSILKSVDLMARAIETSLKQRLQAQGCHTLSDLL